MRGTGAARVYLCNIPSLPDHRHVRRAVSKELFLFCHCHISVALPTVWPMAFLRYRNTPEASHILSQVTELPWWHCQPFCTNSWPRCPYRDKVRDIRVLSNRNRLPLACGSAFNKIDVFACLFYRTARLSFILPLMEDRQGRLRCY